MPRACRSKPCSRKFHDKEKASPSPPLCKGRWHGVSRDGGIVSVKTDFLLIVMALQNNPSVSLTADSSHKVNWPQGQERVAWAIAQGSLWRTAFVLHAPSKSVGEADTLLIHYSLFTIHSKTPRRPLRAC